MTKPDQSGISVCGRVSTAARLLKGKRVEVNQQVKSHDYSTPVLSTHTHTHEVVSHLSAQIKLIRAMKSDLRYLSSIKKHSSSFSTYLL